VPEEGLQTSLELAWRIFGDFMAIVPGEAEEKSGARSCMNWTRDGWIQTVIAS